ncbi:hypothetical protein TNCV_2916691 [Trichonephila clavipes]|nr:hypothetical protein TNCV_2916691 [Trichonephila clavipes]
MVQNSSWMQQSSMRHCLPGMLPMQPFPEHPILLESCANHGGTCFPANKPRSKGGRGVFSGGTTSDNPIAFKRAKALARRIRRQCRREILDPVCVFNHIVNYQSTVMRKRQKAANGRDFNIPILKNFPTVLCIRHL